MLREVHQTPRRWAVGGGRRSLAALLFCCIAAPASAQVGTKGAKLAAAPPQGSGETFDPHTWFDEASWTPRDGRDHLIVFMKDDCDQCSSQLTALEPLAHEKLDELDVTVIAADGLLSHRGRRIKELFNTDEEWLLASPPRLKSHGIVQLPAIVVVGRDGRVKFVSKGPVLDAHEIMSLVQTYAPLATSAHQERVWCAGDFVSEKESDPIFRIVVPPQSVPSDKVLNLEAQLLKAFLRPTGAPSDRYVRAARFHCTREDQQPMFLRSGMEKGPDLVVTVRSYMFKGEGAPLKKNVLR